MVDRVTFILKSPADRAKAVRLVNGVSDGSRFEVKAPRRSNDQNAKLWAMLADISEQVEWYGYKLSSESWKDIFSAGLKKALVVPNLDGTGFVMLGLRTSDMSKQELSDLLELITHFGAERNVKFSGPGDMV
jgi:hypothetical protein